MMNGMSFNFFWIIPLVCIGVFVIRKLLFKGRDQQGEKDASLPQNGNRSSFNKSTSAQIPEELKQAGRQVLENLDWEIRLLEKQRLEATDSKERQEIEENLTRKKEEYRATVERLQP